MLFRFMMVSLFVAYAVSLQAEERVSRIPAADFERLTTVIKPQKGESPWRDIAWLTNVTEARKKAAIEGKPIVIFTAADGSPLGRT
ncbi:MAG: hypothetical protein ACI9HK_004565 [Pirellulaceae bacterium]|jgi:hypothetical protein